MLMFPLNQAADCHRTHTRMKRVSEALQKGHKKYGEKVRKRSTNCDSNIKDALAHKSYPSDCIIPSSLKTQSQSVHVVAVFLDNFIWRQHTQKHMVTDQWISF